MIATTVTLYSHFSRGGRGGGGGSLPSSESAYVSSPSYTSSIVGDGTGFLSNGFPASYITGYE